MYSSLYPFAFLFSLAALTGWFYFRDHPVRGAFLRNLFFLSFTAYSAAWLLGDGQFSYKMTALCRELLVLSLFPVFLNLFRKNRLVYFAMLFVSLGGLRYFYFETLTSTFPQAAVVGETATLDSQGELLVEVLEGHKVEELQPVFDRFKLTASPAFTMQDKAATDLDDYFLVDIPPLFEKDIATVKKALNATGIVEWVEDNEQYTISPIEVTPQRPMPRINKKYGLNDPGLQQLWGFEEMDVATLYPVLKNAKPEKKALIAILDTGIDGEHEDIKANYTSTQSKYDRDRAGHGTHCAGIAAAVSNNNIGVASFSQNNEFVQVTSIKVLSDGGFGTQKMIINGILEAADIGADVISLSLGGLSSDSKQRAYKKAVDYANKKGAIVVVAAGNSNRSAKDFAPANTPGVIAVSALDTLLNRASFSNWVKDVKMGIAAPGVGIYSTYPGGEYQTFNGTSMATPYVSGLVGLMKSLKPGLTTREAHDILKATGRETKSGVETGKLIQPAAAVRALLQ